MLREDRRFHAALIASLLVHVTVIGGIALTRRPASPAASERLIQVDLALLPVPAVRPAPHRSLARPLGRVVPRPLAATRPVPAIPSPPRHAPRPQNPSPALPRPAPNPRVVQRPPQPAPVATRPVSTAPAPVAPPSHAPVSPPARVAPRPRPAAMPALARAPEPRAPRPGAASATTPATPRRTLLAARPGDSGGRLAPGGTSAAGTIDAGSSGATRGGSVPNPAVGGTGSGAGEVPRGRGSAEPAPNPVKTADPGPQVTAPVRHEDPPPAPPPARVTLRVCKRSGLRAGKYCEENTERGFLESDAPAGRCTACKPEPEHVNRVADRAEPEVVREVQPDYPEELREQGVQGTVTVRYTVDENGKVTGVLVERSSGNDALDDAAVRAIRRYRYRPAQQDGKPRAVQMRKPFVFRLSG